MVLEELMGLTDEEFMDSLLFDIRFQYALHTTSFKEQPVSNVHLAVSAEGVLLTKQRLALI